MYQSSMVLLQSEQIWVNQTPCPAMNISDPYPHEQPPALHLSGLPASHPPPTYPRSCRRHCSVRSGVAETSCKWNSTSTSPSARWSSPPEFEEVAGTWNCLCCLRVGGKMGDKRNLRANFWETKVGVNCWPKARTILRATTAYWHCCVLKPHTPAHTPVDTQNSEKGYQRRRPREGLERFICTSQA